jgi:hypothetical protein
MVVLSSLHIHRHIESGDDCQECVEHHCHGHLGQLTEMEHQCVLCQFLTMSFVAATAVAVVCYNNVCNTLISRPQAVVIVDVCAVPSLRAPPVL